MVGISSTGPDKPSDTMTDHWTTWHTMGTLLIIFGVFLVGLLVSNEHRLFGWLVTVCLLMSFIGVVGHGITGIFKGALIDERKKMSLSRLQLILWTIVVLAGYFVAALANLRAGNPNPLDVAIPEDLWLLMGISTTSLIGSPLLRSNKRYSQADGTEQGMTFKLLAKQGTDTRKLQVQGLIVVNETPKAAQWSDIFKGEETGNAGLLDIAKVQMFFFTVILVLAYAMALGTTMREGQLPLTGLPDIPLGMLALLGISHAGYLTNKPVPHSATTATPTTSNK